MDKKTKLIIGGIAVAFMVYILFKKPKSTSLTPPSPSPSPSPNPLPVDTLPPTSEEDFLELSKAYGATKEEACMNKGIPTVTLYMTSAGLSPNKTIFYTDKSHTTPVKSGYYTDKFDLCLYVEDGGLLTEMTTC
jgi:hypothetical protein